MTNEERKALVDRLRWGGWYFDDPHDGKAYASDDPLEAADQIEADGKRIAELEAALSWSLIQLGSETGYSMEGPVWQAYDHARNVLNGVKK